jgi:hypothetical protein
VAGWRYDGLPPPPGRLPSALDEITAEIERQTFARSGAAGKQDAPSAQSGFDGDGDGPRGGAMGAAGSSDDGRQADGLERLRRALQAWAASCGDPAPERRQTFAHPAEPGADSTSPSPAPIPTPATAPICEAQQEATREAAHEAAREVLLALARDHDAGGFERIEFTLDEAALELWTEARARIEAATGNPAVTDRDVLLLAAVEFLLTHLPVWLEEVATGDPIAVRERFRCAIPGCTVRGGAGHHLRYRSQGGPDEPWNLLFVCYEHHIAGIHRNHVRVSGRAPDRLRVELGVRPGHAPLEVFVNGERVTSS